MSDANEPLSEREIEILRLVATGAANKEIALRLAISPNTVKVHLRNIFTKIGVVSRTEATLYALKNGIVRQPEATFGTGIVLGSFASPESTSPLALAPDSPQAPAPARTGILKPALWFTLGAVVLLIIGLVAAPFVIPPPAQATATAAPPQQIIIPPRWQKGTPLPAPRAGMGAVSYESTLYLIGGETSLGISSDVLAFSAGQPGWQSLKSKPTAITDVQAVLLGERIYVPGGQTGENELTTALEVYDPRQDEWQARAPVPRALSRYALAAYEGKLYLFGGWDGSQYLRSVYRYDPERDLWERQSDLPAARADASAVTLEGRIILAGGRSAAGPLSSVLAYYPNRDTAGEVPWEEAPDLPEARAGISAVAMANTIFLVGGAGPGQTSTLALASGAKSWQPIEAPAAFGERAAVVMEGNFLHILGGRNSSALSAEHLVYQALYTVSIPLLSNEGEQTPEP